LQRPSIYLLGLASIGACAQTPPVDPMGEPQAGNGAEPVEIVEVPEAGPASEPVAPLEADPEPDSDSEEDWATGVSDDGHFEATWRVVGGGPIPVNEHFVLELKLARVEEGGPTPWEGADPTVRARMPEHRHGMLTRPVPVDAGGGLYEVPAMLFHMEGYWILRISVRTGDGVLDNGHATFDLNI
jgi:hypothetical protein